jgi:AcrR family transcriptional regulator
LNRPGESFAARIGVAAGPLFEARACVAQPSLMIAMTTPGGLDRAGCSEPRRPRPANADWQFFAEDRCTFPNDRELYISTRTPIPDRRTLCFIRPFEMSISIAHLLHPAPIPDDPSQRLLEAAGEVFAELGFRDATIRDICGRAGLNIAAVNYHFGDKAALYREVLTFASRVALAKHPLGSGVSADAPAAERLGAYIRNFLERLLDSGSPAWHGKLMAREMVDPTDALDGIVEQHIRPQRDRLRGILRELLGPAANEETLRHCTCSVIGQCLFYKHSRPVLDRLMPEQTYGPDERAALARHVLRFSLGGIDALRLAGDRATVPACPTPPSPPAAPRPTGANT